MAADRESSVDWQTETEGADDDMDYELANEDQILVEIQEEEDEDEGTTTVYYDAEDQDEDQDEDTTNAFLARLAQTGDQEGQGTTTATQQRPLMMTPQQLYHLLQSTGLHELFSAVQSNSQQRPATRSQTRAAGVRHVALSSDDEEDDVGAAEEEVEEEYEEEADDDDEGATWFGYRRQRRRNRSFSGPRYPPIPSKEGAELMSSGTFGTNDRCDHSACGEPLQNQYKRRRLSRRLLDRELGMRRPHVLNKLSTHDLIPGSKADMIINLNARCYSGQFSDDGSFYFACGQDFRVRLYDTSNPYDWKYYKTVHYYSGQWTITDASLSPDNKLLAYSSIRSQVCLARTDPTETADPLLLDFHDASSRRQHTGWGRGSGHFGIWSLRFSGDGNEIVAGTSNESVYVYDLEAQRSILTIKGHTDDVNAVCFGDKMSPHILYSGSDDTTLKVWDRRSLSSMRPAGMFLGHTEGLTYIDSKGDGRYVISNAKDQTCKLWDLRKMISTDEGSRLRPEDYTTNFDYRFTAYDTAGHVPHPKDCSLVTFRGHRVLKTLIRCHFSPALSTDQRYVYSGSHDGKIYVWNMDGTEKATIDVLAATKNSRPGPREPSYNQWTGEEGDGTWKTIVRDCSWHPSAPIIAATSWNGWDHQLGTCTVHSWNDGADNDEVGDDNTGLICNETGNKRSLGSTPMGARVTAQLDHDDRFYATRTPRVAPTTRSQRMRNRLLRTLAGNLDDDDD